MGEDIRQQYIERRIDELYGKCDFIIEKYEYEVYGEILKAAKEICKEIETSVWTDDIEQLSKARAEAYYYLGKACLEKCFFDHAVKYFDKAKKAIEGCCAQDNEVKLYVLICIYLVKCYIEKRSKDENIKKAIDDAEKVFCFAIWKDKNLTKLTEIKDISEIISAIKQYSLSHAESGGEQTTEEKKLIKIEKETYLSVGFELCLHRGYAELEISHKEKDEKNFDEVLKYFEIAEGLWGNFDSYQNEHGKKMETLLSTRGRWYKKAYFKEDKTEEEKLKEVMAEAEKKYLTRKAEFLGKAIEQFRRGLNNSEINDGKAEVQGCESKSGILYKGNPKDTICLGNIAALLYNASLLLKREFCNHENAEWWKEKVAEQFRKIYETLIKVELGEWEKKIEEKYEKVCETLRQAEKDKSLYLQIELCDSSRDLACDIVEKILSIDKVNMYALSLAAILYDKKAENSKKEISETDSETKGKRAGTFKDIREKYSVSEKSNHYPILRRSAIKKRFQVMNDNLNSNKCLGNEEKSKAESSLRNIQIRLITMHNIIVDFMDSAIINCEDIEWKNLVVGHYTRLPVLQKLINKEGNSKLRIQNVHHLNDPTEGVVLINSLKNKFMENLKPEEILKKVKGKSIIRLYEQVIDNFSVEKNGKFRSSVYMGSFSARVDKLNMWTQYGDNCRGCCIQIDAAKTFDKAKNIILGENSNNDETNMFTYEDYNYPLYAVIYLPFNREVDLDKLADYADQRANAEAVIEANESLEAGSGYSEKAWWRKQASLIREYKKLIEDLDIILSEIDDEFENLMKNLNIKDGANKNFKKLKDEIVNTIMVLLDMARFLVKSDWYRDEREFRVIQYSSKPLYEENPQGVPKLYVNIEKDIVYKRVCFGSLVQNYDSEAAYVLNIKRNWPDSDRKKTWELEAYKSEIAYR